MTRHSIQGLRRLLQVALPLFFVVAIHAQTITGNINGTVTDPSGAVIPGAMGAINTQPAALAGNGAIAQVQITHLA